MPARRRTVAATTLPTPTRLPKARSLKGVIANFETVIAWAEKEPDNIGYFPTVYKSATIAVDKAVKAKQFEHPEVMAKFALIFAQRYFDALDAYLDPVRGERPTMVWQKHFLGLQRPKPIVFQHLLTAIDAHINLDLGIAAATVGRENMDDLHADFNMINAILASQVQGVLDALGDVSPNLQRIRDQFTDAKEVALINQLLSKFRDLAWNFAVTLAETDEDQQQELIDLQDSWAASLADCYLYPPGLVGLTCEWIADAESRDVAAIVKRLDRDADKPRSLNRAFLV